MHSKYFAYTLQIVFQIFQIAFDLRHHIYPLDKNFDVRTKLYMLIDNSGNAWIPEYNQGMFDNYNIVNNLASFKFSL